ncbi:cerebellin-1-like [Dreissena polymorpha]|uniref:C1q domain-containing protein n=1 Tax=Dreissena polymorpha TaxID=45954 RepID=A0A9D4L802_DREPO|nr:cerebellin-1-like [Dreissena polymorpha]KAH3853730.1 hypothetical protein DPMN_096262 [Dreissena polymorpha]
MARDCLLILALGMLNSKFITTAFASDVDTRLRYVEHQVKAISESNQALQSLVREQQNKIDHLEHVTEAQKQLNGQLLAAMRNVSGVPMSRRANAKKDQQPEVVSFTAVKAIDQIHIGINQNIIFDKVISNIGNGYHADHGLFIAPTSGIYLFSTTLLHRATIGQPLHAVITHSGVPVARIYTGVDIFDSGSQTVIIQVNQGEEVWVRNFDINDENIYGYLYSSFAGVLIVPL